MLDPRILVRPLIYMTAEPKRFTPAVVMQFADKCPTNFSLSPKPRQAKACRTPHCGLINLPFGPRADTHQSFLDFGLVDVLWSAVKVDICGGDHWHHNAQFSGDF